MRNISFALTTEQILMRTKWVTRRLGWANLEPGTLLQPIEKGQGLKKGERIRKIGGPIRVLAVRRESLDLLLYGKGYPADYARRECEREGFPDLTPEQFVAMFCEHNGCPPSTLVTRIQFGYVAPPERRGAVRASDTLSE